MARFCLAALSELTTAASTSVLTSGQLADRYFARFAPDGEKRADHGPAGAMPLALPMALRALKVAANLRAVVRVGQQALTPAVVQSFCAGRREPATIGRIVRSSTHEAVLELGRRVSDHLLVEAPFAVLSSDELWTKEVFGNEIPPAWSLVASFWDGRRALLLRLPDADRRDRLIAEMQIELAAAEARQANLALLEALQGAQRSGAGVLSADRPSLREPAPGTTKLPVVEVRYQEELAGGW
jgi:hypothetical protein